MDLRQLPLTFSGHVEAQHLDFLDHMNVMWYTHFFDEATWGFYNQIGFGHAYHQGQKGSFALEQHTRHLAEMRAGDSFKIFTRVLGRNDKVWHFMHFMLRERDTALAATSELLGIHIDMRTRRSSTLPPEAAALWDRWIEEHGRLDWEAPISGAIRYKQKSG